MKEQEAISGRPILRYSPGPGLWSLVLVLGPVGPDLGPDLGPGPELDNRENNRNIITSPMLGTHSLNACLY